MTPLEALLDQLDPSTGEHVICRPALTADSRYVLRVVTRPAMAGLGFRGDSIDDCAAAALDAVIRNAPC